MRLRIILLGQLLSAVNAASQLFSEALSKRFLLDLSGIQPLIAYVGIFLASCPFFFLMKGTRTTNCKNDPQDKTDTTMEEKNCEPELNASSPHVTALNRIDIWKHLIAALLDCSATFLVVRSFRYLSIFHVVMLLSLSTPFSMFFSMIFLKRRFSMLQFLGTAISLTAVAVFIFAPMKGIYDYQASQTTNAGDSTNTDPLPTTISDNFVQWEYILGQVMGVSSAALYALSNIAQEWLINRNGILSFLFCLGLFGSIASLGLCFLVVDDPIDLFVLLFIKPGEEKVLSSLCLAGFGISLLLFYCINPLFLRAYGATTFNLSLLTSIIYSSGCAALWWWFELWRSDADSSGMGIFLLQYTAVLISVLLGQYLFLVKDIVKPSSLTIHP